jgi:integrase/recombinase XerD
MNPDAFSSIASPECCSLTLEVSRQRYLEHRSMLGSTTQGLYAIDRYTAGFVTWCKRRQVALVREVTAEVLAEYPRWLHRYRQKNGQPLAVTSRLAKLIPLRGWFKWLARTRQLAFDPSQGLELPVAARSLPRHLPTLQDVEAVLASPNLRLATGLRDRALLELLFATGIRRMEVAGARLADLDLQRRLLLVRCGKGRKDRMVPLGERATHWLRRYVEEARPALTRRPEETAVFVGSGGKPLSLNWLSTLVARHVRAALPGRPGSCHLLRHAMATMMLEGGADIRYIQLMLGHAQLVTTQIYTHVAIGRLQAVHATCHPYARLPVDPQDPHQ